jgi:MFS family permease
MSSVSYTELLKENRNFRHFWIGQVISGLGTWFSFIAELGLVRMISGSSIMTAALLVSRLLPYLFVAPIAGVLVDRGSRKHIMIGADLLRAVIAIVYLFVPWIGSAWLAVLCSGLIISLTIFFDAGKSAALPNMVSPRELLTANVLMFSTNYLQLTLGAALGGIAAAQFGYNIAFIINALSFLASAWFIWLIPATEMRKASQDALSEDKPDVVADSLSADVVGDTPIPGSEQSAEHEEKEFWPELREGLSYSFATPFVRALILVTIFWSLGGGMINLLYDQMGRNVFANGDTGRGDWGVAMLLTSGGAGLFAGMILARRVGAWAVTTKRAGQLIGWSLLIHGIFFAIAGLMPSLILAMLWVAASRLVVGIEFGLQETMMMRVLPDKYRGRVMTTDLSLNVLMLTVSMLIGGWMLTWVGPRAMMLASGLMSASPGLFWLLALWLTRFSVPARAVQESANGKIE